MTLGFWISDACLIGLQSALVALPRGRPPAILERLAGRLAGRAWALIPLASIVLVVVAIRAAGATADGLTWLALIAVPPLAAAALGWASHGAKPPLALLAVPLAYGLWLAIGTSLGAILWLALCACVVLALRWLRRRGPGDVKRAVVTLIAAVALLDGLFLAAAGWSMASLLATAAFGVTLLLQRVVPGT